MSNSPLATYRRITKNKNSPRNHKIDTITIHCMAGQMTGRGCADYFATTTRQVSSNYCIGFDGDIAVSVDEGDRSWCSCSPSNDHRAITIEVATDSYAPYKCTDKAYAALLNLVTDICKRNGIKKLNYTGDTSGNMTKHKWFASTACPGAYLEGKFPEIEAEVNKRLSVGSDVQATETKPKTGKKNYLTYPTKNMNITQGITGDSHTNHSTGTPADYPIDDGCSDEGRDWFYCPCDELRVKHIYGVWNNKKTNTIWLESTSPVVMPCGEDYVTIHVVHPNDDTIGGIKEGQVFKRGEPMFLEGNDGNADGYHFHIAVGTGKFVDPGWVLNNKGSWVHKTTGKQLKPEEVFFVDPTFTKIIKTKGIDFKTLPTETEDSAVSKTEATTTATTTAAKTDGTVMYRVQIGSYKNKKNAEALAAQAKAKGFNVAIVPYLKGDVDGDGEVTAADAREAMRIATGLEE